MSDDKKHDASSTKITKKDLATAIGKAFKGLDHSVKHRISIADAEAISEAMRDEFQKRGFLAED